MERRKATGEAVQGQEPISARKNKLRLGSRTNGRTPAAPHKMRFKISGHSSGIKILAILGILFCAGNYVYSSLIGREIRQLKSEGGALQRQNLELEQNIDSLNSRQNRLAKENVLLSGKLDSLKLVRMKKPR